ncbi:1-acyl-sn-glycerol-3-phosphate acyltransferase [Chlorogloeopsis sp. ULAP01]|uniref:1-acyl-sn-glycerol-3-phosphate acyltransferase n=1 Tax=Chlorogloeopsis sp. ULAP01 TaxID=3056483 RepID=UPI0025AAA43E|nr:1-acyl-sn-glycerol-3-phosphate acyltransferase [Chlorogloeopsis sp. ULAP01]MDM9380401.1 1-acyl-sn-glycerol-3-phosphate acyltransferase [Chlorogloeopsis sp. ULAP01]
MINQNQDNLLSNPIERKSIEGYKFNWFDWFCLWYPPGWLILFNRHWQHYHLDPDGWNWFEYILFLIPGGFYLALLIRWLRLGCRLPHQGNIEFDPNYQQAFRQEIIAPIVEYYFRGELLQTENLPSTEPMIVAMNHAGMSFPWDFLSLAYLLNKERGWVVKVLAGVPLFDHAWMIWWLPPGWSKVLGGVRAELEDFSAVVQERRVVLYAPEGLRGPSKGWRKRYQLEKFDLSFMQLSQRFQIPILPVVCIGNESLHPWTINLQKLQQLFNLPFLPVSPLIPFFILFPSMGVWAMRSRLHYFIQPLQRVVNSEQQSKNKRSFAFQKAQILRENMQSQINNLLNKNIENKA